MSARCNIGYQDVIAFWFVEVDARKRWVADNEFDQLITDRFGDVHSAAVKCELSLWRKTPLGRLAEIILLDQFSRNIYRNNALSFACDPLALALAQEAINTGANQPLDSDQKAFLYMPYMHSESPQIHDIAVALFGEPGLESNLHFELKHKAIIDKFGRYPHRNKILKRQSTAQEIEFLKGPGSSF